MRGNKLLKILDFYLGGFIVLLLFLVSTLLTGSKKKEGSVVSTGDPRFKKSLDKILVLKLAALGDTLLLIPSLRSLRRSYPHAQIAMVCTSINKELIQLFPQYVDRLLIFDVKRAVLNPAYFIQFVKDLRKERFTASFDFEQWSMITPIIAWLSGAELRVGFKIHKPVRHLLYSTVVERRRDKHEAENFLALLNVIGIPATKPVLELPVNRDRAGEVLSWLGKQGWNSSKPLVVVHPGCGVHGFPREWPVESFKKLCANMASEFDPFFAFTGSDGERHLTRALHESFPKMSAVWDESGLEALIALISLSTLFVSGNNGIMHVAAALRVPQIALHGPTDSRKWGPLSPEAVVLRSSCPGCPCLDLGFEYHRTDGFCMAQISVDDVYRAARRLLTRKPSPTRWTA